MIAASLKLSQTFIPTPSWRSYSRIDKMRSAHTIVLLAAAGLVSTPFFLNLNIFQVQSFIPTTILLPESIFKRINETYEYSS